MVGNHPEYVFIVGRPADFLKWSNSTTLNLGL